MFVLSLTSRGLLFVIARSLSVENPVTVSLVNEGVGPGRGNINSVDSEVMIRLSSLPAVGVYSAGKLLLRSSLVPSRGYSQLYCSVEEHPEPIEGKICGSVPQWLSGRLIRNGPGLMEVGDTKYHHLFDGLALLHSFTINQGKVWYQSRFLRSETYKKNMAANRIVVTEFGTVAHPDPCKTLFQRMFSIYQKIRDPHSIEMTDNCMVNVIPIGEELIAATETDFVHQFDRKTLESTKRHKLSKKVAVNSATAHAHMDVDGTVYNLGNSFGGGGANYNVIKIHPPKHQGEELFDNASVVCSIPATDKFSPGYYHSFGLTENYVVFMEQPLKVDVRKMLLYNVIRKPAIGALRWDPNENVRFYVVEKATGKVIDTHFTSPAFFVFHHINAYEDEGHIVVDVCAFESGEVATNVSLDAMNENDIDLLKPMSRRYVLPLSQLGLVDEGSNMVTLKNTRASAMMQTDGSVLCLHEDLCSIPFDFPQINYKNFNGRKYRYTYGAKLEPEGLSDLLKMDVADGSTKCWSETDCSPSEPVFVPSPDAKNEDDGVILSTVIHNERKRAPFLVILDARDMEEVGRVEFGNIQMHKDFHGIFCHM